MKISADQAIGFSTTDGSSINGGPIEPFLKWAGGKRWAVPRLLAEAPTDFDRYIEPFLGGGSLFFALRPARAILADVNGELINAYERVRDQADQIQRQLLRLESIHSKELYYAVRSRQGHGNLWRAVRFIYLNRTCWNGLYRVNTRGEFNVPIGSKTMVGFNKGLGEQARVLQPASLKESDFRSTLRSAKKNDFVYIDPPYTVRHNNNGFLKYNETIFSWSDQEALKIEVCRAIDRGAKVLISNAAHDSVKELYAGVGRLIDVERSSVLAASASFRRREKEILIRCY